MSASESTSAPSLPVRHKLLAGLAGLLAGPLGLHRWYLRQPLWWLLPILCLPLIGHALRQPEYYREWSFYAFGLLTVIAWLQTIIICLMPVDEFNQRFNAHALGQSKGGPLPVLIAVLLLLLGTTLLMAVLALAMEALFMSSGG